MGTKARPPIPIETQVEVLFRDGWLCSLCGRPTVFHLALKHLNEFVHTRNPDRPLAYWDLRWRRDAAPLLNELAACIDHVQAYSRDGAHDITNFAVACARCNARKGNKAKGDYLEANPLWRVKSKHGEPKNWDGLSSIFVVLAKDNRTHLTPKDREWLIALERYFATSTREG